ncbi:hypothetical protein [Amycolatopsis jejuensis]|uniref:hypothetical protein n=1 Tax=Amycolatopsis jejuensis TaxID=330084 RepID=UPI0005253E88|nr:hypothetical protein [Amycolatopsis jejuensis]
MDIDALLASAKLPEDTVALCLRPDLRDRFEKLDGELLRERSDRTTLAPGLREGELADELAALEAEIAEHTLPIVLRGLSHEPWAKLLAAHPPREDKPGDLAMGMNLETFVPAMVRASIVEPELSDEQYELLIDVISDNQYATLQNAAWLLSRGDKDSPVFNRAASRETPDSGETPRRQSGSGSPRPGSRGKNRKS